MQQDKTEMQAVKQLQTVRRFPIGSDEKDVCDVERMLIEKYLGIPYVHQGRSLDGLDCWGLLKCVYREFGFELFDIEQYCRTWSLSGSDYFKQHYERDWQQAEKPQFLDAVLFLNSRGIANHAGIVLTGGRFIHACRQGVIISRLNERSWSKNIEGYYRLKNDTNT